MAANPDNVSTLPTGAGKGAKSNPPAEHGPLGPKDNEEVLAAVQRIEQEMTELEEKRKGLNDQISALRQELKTRSIDMNAFRAARAQKKLNPNRRHAFDTDMFICRKAFDLPIQTDMLGQVPDDGEDAPAH